MKDFCRCQILHNIDSYLVKEDKLISMARVTVGADHAGFALKNQLVKTLTSLGHTVKDIGTHSEDKVDYPDFGAAVAKEVSVRKADFGVCVCGSGLGIAMAANKIPGVRAAPIHDTITARLAREHNDANVVCFGARLIDLETAKESLRVFCDTSFSGGRHASRVEKLEAII